jgi:hypothetical protein
MNLNFSVLFLFAACLVSNVEAQTRSENTFHGLSGAFILGSAFIGTCLVLTACGGAIAYRYGKRCQEVEDSYPIELSEEAYPDAKPAFEKFDSEVESCSTISLSGTPLAGTPENKHTLVGRQGSMVILACINDGFPIDLDDAEDIFFDDYGNVTKLNRSVCFDYDDNESNASPEMKSQHNKKNVEFQAD